MSDGLKKVFAVLGAAIGSLALFYVVFASLLPLKNFGLSVESQLVAQRIITPLLFVSLGAFVVSCEYFRRIHQGHIKSETKTDNPGALVRGLRVAAVVVLPAVIVFFTLNTPFWSYPSPSLWDRPRFDYGWPLPWKGEKMEGMYMICPFLNLFFWTFYVMLIVGYRRIKHYLVMLGVMLVLFCLYAKLFGVGTHYRQVRRKNADGQMVSTQQLKPQPKPQPKQQPKSQSPFEAMTDEDKAFYAYTFTTIGTVPFGKCWPENLYKILSAGRDTGNADKVMFNAPDGFKQNEGYSEWLRVKSVIVDTKTRKVIGTRGRVGPFKDVEAVNSYLVSEVRPDLNSQVFIVRNETEDAGKVMRFVCESKYGTNYSIQIKLREESATEFWIDVEGTLE